MKIKVMSIITSLLMIFQVNSVFASQIFDDEVSVYISVEESIRDDDILQVGEKLKYDYTISNLTEGAKAVSFKLLGFAKGFEYLEADYLDESVYINTDGGAPQFRTLGQILAGNTSYIIGENKHLSIQFEVDALDNFDNVSEPYFDNSLIVNEQTYLTEGDRFKIHDTLYQTDYSVNSNDAYDELTYTGSITNTNNVIGSPKVQLDVSDVDFAQSTIANPEEVDVEITKANGETDTIKMIELVNGYHIGELKKNESFKFEYDVKVRDDYYPPLTSLEKLTSTVKFSESGLTVENFLPKKDITLDVEFEIDGFEIENNLVNDINGSVQPNEKLDFKLDVKNLSKYDNTAIVQVLTDPKLIDMSTLIVKDELGDVVCDVNDMSLCNGNFRVGFEFNVKPVSDYTITYSQYAPESFTEAHYYNEVVINKDKDSERNNKIVEDILIAHYKVSKTANKNEVAIGEQIDYEIKIDNTNPTAKGGIIVKDEFLDESFNTLTGEEVVTTNATIIGDELLTINDLKNGVSLEVEEDAFIKFSVQTSDNTIIGNHVITNTVKSEPIKYTSTIDSDISDDTFNTYISKSDFSIKSTVDKDTNVAHDELLNFEIDVTNKSALNDKVVVESDLTDVALHNAEIKLVGVENAISYNSNETDKSIELEIEPNQTAKIKVTIKLNLKENSEITKPEGTIMTYFILNDKGTSGEMCSTDSTLDCIAENEIKYVINE